MKKLPTIIIVEMGGVIIISLAFLVEMIWY